MVVGMVPYLCLKKGILEITPGFIPRNKRQQLYWYWGQILWCRKSWKVFKEVELFAWQLVVIKNVSGVDFIKFCTLHLRQTFWENFWGIKVQHRAQNCNEIDSRSFFYFPENFVGYNFSAFLQNQCHQLNPDIQIKPMSED